MPVTYNLIASNTLSSSAASVTFSAIPGTYTDLVLRISARNSSSFVVSDCILKFNGDATTTNYSETYIEGSGSTAVSGRNSNQSRIYTSMVINGDTSTSSTFGSLEVYIPSYTVSQNKSLSLLGIQETNATAAYMEVGAGLYRNTAAITSIEMTLNSTLTFNSGSSFFLYGIKNS